MGDYEFKDEDLHLDLRPRRKKRFYNTSPTKINLFTWNTNGKPAPTDLHTVFPQGSDIYAIGLQEVGSFDWLAAFDNIFRSYNVIRVKTRRLQGIVTIVYVRRELLNYIHHIESETTRTGLGGMWGNKGGVSIRFDLLGVNVIVVNCHLAAHMEKVVERLEDIDAILENQHFKDNEVNNILDHDYIFWMGDLNFRLDDTSYEEAIKSVEQKNYSRLLEKDQLMSVMKDELAFCGFQESAISFAPTYKYDVGTGSFDTSPKKRVPAYCDRIQYHFHETHYSKKDILGVTSLEYNSLSSFCASDHKPVSCALEFRGLHSPPGNKVVFTKSKRLTSNGPLVIKFSFKNNFKAVSGDWVGIYKVGFMHFDDYITYQWVPSSSRSNQNSSQVSIAASALKKIQSPVIACYIDKQFHFSGISDPIDISV